MSESEVAEKTEKEVIMEHVTKLFGDEVAKLFQEEEITSYSIIADLLKKDADAGIFKNLGLKYGAAVRFKHEFLKVLPTDLVGRSPVASPRLKPTMGAMSGFDPNMKRLYLSKRKRVGILAIEHWRGDYPKFNNPEKKAGLQKFASQIEAECGIPEIGFTSEGIAQHIQDFFNEQRRYKKRNNGQQIVMGGQDSEDIAPTVKSSKPSKRKISEPPGKRFRAGLASLPHLDTSAEQDDDSNSDTSGSSSGEDTLSVKSGSEQDTGISDEGHKSPPKETAVPTTATSSNVVIKAVFGKLLSREQIVNILKTKFQLKQSDLTPFTPTQLQQLLIKKLIKFKYVTLKEGKTNSVNKDDVTVHKEIEV